MDRLFLDANVLFSAVYRGDAGVRRLWQLPNVQLVTSAYAAEEARRSLASNQVAALQELLDYVQVLAVAEPDRTIPEAPDLPDKDRPILLAAIESCATHLVTGDVSHFGSHYGKTIEGVLVVTPADYLRPRKRGRS